MSDKDVSRETYQYLSGEDVDEWIGTERIKHSTMMSFKPSWDGDGDTVLMRCGCGSIATLNGHDVAADGRVTPSVVCPDQACSFHSLVVLDGWLVGSS